MKIDETVRRMKAELEPLYGAGEATAIVRLIFHSLKGWELPQLLMNGDREASPWLEEKIAGIMERLKRREPLQYILGEAYFYGLHFNVTPAVLIPRQDSEPLIDMILRDNRGEDLHVLDIGTGSGCLAIALARNLPFARVTAIDNSAAALEVAGENARLLKARVDFIEADIFKWEPADSSLDIIVSNPPYIDESEKKDMDSNVKDYEPAQALFVPDDNPLLYYRRIAAVAAKGLKPGARLYLEINPRHADDIRSLLQSDGFADVDITLDIHGARRFATCRRPEAD